MSLILDALKRAESERGAQAASGLPELSPVPLGEPPGHRRWILIGAVLIVIAGLGVWRFSTLPPKAEPAAVSEAPVAMTPVVSAPAVAPPPLPPQPAPAARPIAGTEEVTSFEEVTGPEDAQAESPSAPPVSSPAPAAAVTPAAIEPTPVAVVEPPAATAMPHDKTPVRLLDTPTAYRASFPIFTIQVHSWGANPAARFVRINGYRYVEGETLAEGPTLIEITERGLVLDWKNERVIYPLK